MRSGIAYAIIVVAGVAVAGLAPTPARADAIDGDWCKPESSLRMTIRGPEITTPGGRLIRGDYSRHAFSYVVPVGEPGTGETVSMVLRGEYLVHVRQGGPDAPWQEWRRCAATTS